MTKENFTSGTWQIFDIHPTQACLEVAPEGNLVSFTGCEHVVGGICTVYNVRDDHYENACLIKTAPKMYHELQEVSNWMNTQFGMGEWHKAIEKLLAEARGEL